MSNGVRDRMNVYSLVQDSINNTARHRRRTETPLSFETFLNIMIDSEYDSFFSDIIDESMNWAISSENEQLLSVKDLFNKSKVELYSDTKEYKYTDTECCICTLKFVSNETIIRILECDHKFCISCIDTWLCSNTKCPMCKKSLV